MSSTSRENRGAKGALREKAEEFERRLSEPVAIVGLGCRFPGGVVDADTLWDLVASGADAVRRVPATRWPTDSDSPLSGADHAALLDDITSFDADFFGIPAREAVEMDPAQRLLLEVSWEALEHAAINPHTLKNSPTGVYVGLGLADYGRRHFLSEDDERLTPWSGTGTFLSVAAGRISYFLGLNGPAVTVETACSS